MTAFRRLGSGGRMDRSITISFTYDGQRLFGHEGDTLASALLASCQRVSKNQTACSQSARERARSPTFPAPCNLFTKA
jgi:hypothetical protein